MNGADDPVDAPQFARVGITTLRDLRVLAEKDARLGAELDHLIAVAEERAWPL